MSKKEENELLKALEYFNLGVDFTEEDLKKALENKNKFIEVDFRNRKVDETKLEMKRKYYFLLYKWSKVKFVEEVYFKDIKFSDSKHGGKMTINNVPDYCAEFYKNDYLYHSCMNSLLNNIKANYNIFCNIDIENASNIEQVDSCLAKFENTIRNDYERFLDSMVSTFANKNLCNKKNLNIKFDIEKINSTKELLIGVYNLLDGLVVINRNEYIKRYTELAKEYFERNSEEAKASMNYYAQLIKQSDEKDFLNLYNTAFDHLKKFVFEKYKRLIEIYLTEGSEEYIKAIKYYNSLADSITDDEFFKYSEEAYKYIKQFIPENKNTKNR